MQRPVLLLIDFQKAFAPPCRFGVRNNPAAEVQAAKALEAFRVAGLPVIHVRHDSTEPASPLRPGAVGHGFLPFAEPQPDEPLVAKTVNAAFIGTDLADRLAALHPDAVIVMGISTEHCVSTSVRVGANLGFPMLVLADCCAAFEKQTPDGHRIDAETVHQVSLATLAGEFARIASADEILAAIATQAR